MGNYKLKSLNLYFFTLLFQLPLMAQNQEFGYLKFDLNVDSAVVIINNEYFEPYKISSGDSIKLNAGRNLVNISYAFDAMYEQYIDILPNQTLVIKQKFGTYISAQSINANSAAYYHYNADLIVLTDYDSEIYVNGEYAGTAFAKLLIDAPRAIITIKNPLYGTKQHNVNMRHSRVNVLERYNRPTAGNALKLSAIPGAAQFYKKDYLKSGLFALSTFAVAKVVWDLSINYDDEYRMFKGFEHRYREAQTETDAVYWADLANRQLDTVQRIGNLRTALIGVGILIYAYNIFDAIKTEPRGGFQKRNSLNVYLSSENKATSLNIQYNF